jgi:hypothetical protein
MDRFVSSYKDVKLTNQDRIGLVKEARKNLRLKDVRAKIDAEAKLYNEEMLNMELDLIENQDPICTKELSKLISSQAYKLNFELLSTLIQKQFYNVDIMKTMRCVLYSVVKDEVSYYELMQTTKVLKKEKKSNFIIFFQNLFNGKNKIFSTKYEGINTLHESIIGLMAANKVREVLPTFIWTYGITPCNMPLLKSNHRMVSGCTRPVNYKNKGDYIGMITEYIEGETLGSFIKNKNLTEEYLYSIILSILYSSKYAYEMTGLIHWDLHTDNIQMRTLDYDDYYIYLPNEKKYLWVGGHLATIFDFGLSSMKMNGKTYGYFDFMEFGIHPKVNYSIQNDVLKFIVNLFDISDSMNDEEKTIVDKIYMYFTQLDTIEERNKFDSILNKNYGIFPNGSLYNINSFTNITIDDLIQFVENMIPYDLSYLIESKQPSRVLSCNNGNCIPEVKIYEELFNGPTVDMVTSDLKDIDPRDVPNVKLILNKYLDAIFNAIPIAENKPLNESLDMIIDFNSIRLTQEKLNKIETVTNDIKGLEDVNERVQKIKDKVKYLIHKYYEVANKSITNIDETKFAETFDTPKDQIKSQFDLLKELFAKSRK